MRATYIDHSGFLVELPSVSLLFDWQDGALPSIPEGVPLLVFASHHHPDHFDPKIFRLDDGTRNVRFLLGKDIKLSGWNQRKWGLKKETADKCRSLSGGETAEVLPGVTVETLASTDEGVAFLVTADGKTIYHAGDLNWWHWEGEDKAWNNNMEANFKKYTQPLQGRRIDLAMLPLDPRQKEWGYWGAKYYLDLADIQHFLPMHQWDDFTFTEDFLEAYPKYALVTDAVREPGQTFTY